jgi:hypothetical protein
MVALRALQIWLVIIAAESIHGTIRTVVLVPWLGDLPARQLCVFTGSIIIFTIAAIFSRWLRATAYQQIAVGVFWVVLTVLFEIVLGRFVLHFSWDRIVHDYDVTRGGLMGFGLLFMALTPWLAARLRSAEAITENTT